MTKIYVGQTLNFQSQINLLSLGNGPIGDGFVDNGFLYVNGNNVVNFFWRAVGNKSAFCILVCNANIKYTFYKSQIYSVGNHIPGTIIPLGNFRFLVFCNDGTFYNLQLNNSYNNNTIPYIVYPSNSITPPCGISSSGTYNFNDKYLSIYWAVSNSQNGGYIYNSIYNKKDLSVVQSGLQGSYEGAVQTYYSVNSTNLTEVANTAFSQSNGLNTNIYTGSGNYYTAPTNYNIKPGAFNSCGPLPSSFPFPGNWSGASCSGLIAPLEYLYNGSNGYKNTFDTDFPGLVGGYNVFSYPNNNTANACLIDGFGNYCFYRVTYVLRYSSFCLGKNVCAGMVTGANNYLIFLAPASGNISVPFPPQTSTQFFRLQNLSRPVSVLGNYKT